MIDNRLKYIVRDLEYKISQQCPEAIVQVSYDAFEDIDALVRVYAPADRVDALDEMTGDWVYELVLNEGYNIVVPVYDLALRRPEQNAGWPRRFVTAREMAVPVLA